MNTNSGVPTLGVEFIKKIPVPFPEENEQYLIAKCLDSASEKIKVEVAQRTKLIKQKAGLVHDLLTGKVKVTVNIPEAPHAL